MTPHRPDTTPAIESPGTAADDPAASLESDLRAPASERRASADPQLATSAFTTTERPPRGRASRLVTLMRSLWIILRERAK